jgi:DNA-directed RNA polymerase specialized sigma24 family protein
MSSHGSVTHWLGLLEAGDHAAAQKLWNRFFKRLVGLAGQILPRQVRRVADGEDVALSALDSFFRCAERGRFPRLLDRHDLWQLLVVITARKAYRQVAYANAEKRGGGRPTETLPPETAATAEDLAIGQVLSREPTPEFAAQVAEEYQRLLDALEDDQLRKVAMWKMESYTNEEIAGKLKLTLRSIERKLGRIRKRLRVLHEEEGQ